MNTKKIRVVAAVVFLAGMLAVGGAGCGKKPSDEAGAKMIGAPPAAAESAKIGAPAVPAAALEEAIALWAGGDQVGAEKKFMATDWKNSAEARPLFGLTEKAYIALPEKERQAKTAELLERSANLRALVRFLVATAKTARDSGDAQKARVYFTAIRDCGVWLNDENHAVMLINLIGKAFEQAGRQGLESVAAK